MKRAAAMVVALALATAATARADDLLQVWRDALAADPVLAAAVAQQRAIGEGVVQARALLLPQASAVASADQSQLATSGDARNRGRGASVGVTQTVLDFASRSRVDVARANADASDASARAATQTLALRVATAYFGVLSARETLANAEANEDAFAQLERQSRERYANGLSAQVDVEQASAYRAAAQAQAIAARSALADAREAVAEITGHAPAGLAPLAETLAMPLPEPADADAWVRAALVANPTLAAQSSTVAAAERAIDVARNGHLPTLSASFGVGRFSAWPQPAGNDGKAVATVGLVVSLPLSSGGLTQSQVRQALSQRDGARDELERRRRAVTREVLAQYRGTIAAVGEAAAQRTAVESARRALASTRVGQQLGTQTTTDLLIAIQTFSAAQNAWTEARHRYVLAGLQLKQAAGSLGEADLAAVNALLQPQ